MTTETKQSKPGQVLNQEVQLQWKNHGTVKAYAQRNNLDVARVVRKSMTPGSDKTTILFRDNTTNKVQGIMLGKKAADKFPVGESIDPNNLYVQSAALPDDSGDELFVITAGGSIAWTSPDDL